MTTARNLSLDLLKLAMAVMVVGLHGAFLKEEMPVLSHFLRNGLFRVAVPAFFLISGFYLERQLARQGAHWFGRVAIMFGLWTLIYSVLWFDFRAFSLKVEAWQVLLGFYQLWYLFALLAGAAVFVVVRRVAPSSQALLGWAAVAFGVGLVLQYAGNWHLAEDPQLNDRLNTPAYYRNFLFMAFPFLTLGAVMAREEARLAPISRATAVLLPLALLALVVEWAVNYFANRPSDFDLYLSLLAVCPMLLLAARRLRIPGQTKAVALVATCIFLLHPLFLTMLERATDLSGTPRTLIALALSVLLAPAIIWMDRKLPLL